MGKGDKKTAKGKRVMGSYGNTRKRKSDEKAIIAPVKIKKEKNNYKQGGWNHEFLQRYIY